MDLSGVKVSGLAAAPVRRTRQKKLTASIPQAFRMETKIKDGYFLHCQPLLLVFCHFQHFPYSMRYSPSSGSTMACIDPVHIRWVEQGACTYVRQLKDAQSRNRKPADDNKASVCVCADDAGASPDIQALRHPYKSTLTHASTQ